MWWTTIEQTTHMRCLCLIFYIIKEWPRSSVDDSLFGDLLWSKKQNWNIPQALGFPTPQVKNVTFWPTSCWGPALWGRTWLVRSQEALSLVWWWADRSLDHQRVGWPNQQAQIQMLGRQEDHISRKRKLNVKQWRIVRSVTKYSVKRQQTFSSTLVYEVNVARF